MTQHYHSQTHFIPTSYYDKLSIRLRCANPHCSCHDQFRLHCPLHFHLRPSLAVSLLENDCLGFACDFGCAESEILQALISQPTHPASAVPGGEPHVYLPAEMRPLCPKPVANLLESPLAPREWIWDGIIPACGLALLAAKPKVGKSVFCRNLALKVARGTPFLERSTKESRVLYVSLEDSELAVREHFQQLGAAQESLFVVATRAVPTINQFKQSIANCTPSLLIVDPIVRTAAFQRENDYTHIYGALAPLANLAQETSCAILLTHHEGKRRATEFDAVLGSTAFSGMADTILCLRKKSDGPRTLQTFQRYGDPLEETVLELHPETRSFVALGLARDLASQDAQNAILRILADNPGLTEQQIKSFVKGNSEQFRSQLRALLDRGLMRRQGDGFRGDPYRYFLSPSGSLPEADADIAPARDSAASTTGFPPVAAPRPAVAHCRPNSRRRKRRHLPSRS